MTPDDPRHGTVNGYCNLRCRCEACRKAWRDYPNGKASRARYRVRLGIPPRSPARPLSEIHGTYYAYTKRKCRCEACREAARTYMRNHRNKQGASE